MRFWSADSCSCRADAGNDQHTLGAGERAQAGNLLRRADKSANPGLQAHPRQQLDLFGGRALQPDGIHLGLVHAGEHSYGQQLRRVGDPLQSALRRG